MKQEDGRLSVWQKAWQTALWKGDLAIVSHGAMLAYVVEYLMRNDPNDQEIIVGNASITTIRYEPESGRAVLIQANDQTHLAELTS